MTVLKLQLTAGGPHGHRGYLADVQGTHHPKYKDIKGQELVIVHHRLMVELIARDRISRDWIVHHVHKVKLLFVENKRTFLHRANTYTSAS